MPTPLVLGFVVTALVGMATLIVTYIKPNTPKCKLRAYVIALGVITLVNFVLIVWLLWVSVTFIKIDRTRELPAGTGSVK